MDDEAAIAWQEALDEVAAGRTEGLPCPFCAAAPLAVEARGQGRTRVSCASCKRFIEGAFQGG